MWFRGIFNMQCHLCIGKSPATLPLDHHVRFSLEFNNSFMIWTRWFCVTCAQLYECKITATEKTLDVNKIDCNF